jgi:UDP-N-acetyl-D-mannosaminuronic acid dehydrogenase
LRAVVVALGKIGLPIAAQIARAGHDVVGTDIDPRVVELVNAGQAPFPGEAGLGDALAELVPAGRLRASTDTTAAVAAGPDLVIAVPPLVVDEQHRPDTAALDAVVADIGRGLQRGTTVSIETTLPLGTTRVRVLPALEEASGLREGEDFHLVFSPERVFSGRIFHDLATYPKLVGGISPGSEARGAELYRSFIPAEVWEMGSAEAAELAKLAETTYRHLNIALANEFARHADRVGVDIARVIEAANSQPYSHIHRPGVAVGGHCIPVYPHFYLAGDPDARLPRVADEINREMPGYAVAMLERALDGLGGARVLILGVAYRGGVKETAFSGALPLRDELARRGAVPLATDPLYQAGELEALGFEAWDGEPVDAAILQADHPEYAALGPGDVPGAQVVIDGRGALDDAALRAAGVRVLRIGRGDAPT